MATRKFESGDRIVWITYDRVIFKYDDGREEDTGKYYCYWSNTEPQGLFYGQRFVDQNGVPIFFDGPDESFQYYLLTIPRVF